MDSVYGKLLRINPDPDASGATTSANGEYSIPDDNSFVGENSLISGEAALGEIYANGFRSPFRISINSDDEVFLGDVGLGAREEINRIVAGGNYGWGIVEGSIGLSAGGAADLPAGFAVQFDGSQFLIGPELEISQTGTGGAEDPAPGDIAGLDFEAGTNAVIAGEIYEGDLFEGLQGNILGAAIGNFLGSGEASRVFFGEIDDDLFDISEQVTQFTISDNPDNDTLDNVQLLGDQALPNIITGVFEGFNGEIFVIGLEGTNTPGVDEPTNNPDNVPGNLVIVRLVPEGFVIAVPEPSSITLLGLGALAMLGRRKRQRLG